MQRHYTKSALNVLNNTAKEAEALGHNYIGTEHLLLALIHTKGVASEVLRENRVDYEKIADLIEENLCNGWSVALVQKAQQTPRMKEWSKMHYRKQNDWEPQEPEQSIC